jgi:hypothetical protein
VDREGELLFAESFVGRAARGDFVVPHPQEARVRVRDKAGNAIAGTTIRIEAGANLWGARPNALGGHRSMCEWRIVGETDAAGETIVSVPTRAKGIPYPRGFSMLVASKRGYRASLGGFYGGIVIDGEGRGKLPEDGVLPFTLEKAATWSGRIVDSGGRPEEGTSVEVSAQMLLPMGGGGLREYATQFQTLTNADGTFRFDELSKEFASVLCHVGMPRSDRGLRQRAPALLKVDLEQPLLLDFRTLPVLGLHVLDSNGLPARNAHVMLLPVPIGERKLDASTHILRLDNAGKASVPMQPGSWQVLATDGIGLQWKVVEVTKDRRVSLKLAELPVLRGTILKDPDASLRQIHFGVNGESYRGGDTMDEGIVRSIGTSLNGWLLAGTVIGKEGAFTMHFAEVDRTELRTYVKLAKQRVSFRLSAGAGLVLDLRSK